MFIAREKRRRKPCEAKKSVREKCTRFDAIATQSCIECVGHARMFPRGKKVFAINGMHHSQTEITVQTKTSKYPFFTLESLTKKMDYAANILSGSQSFQTQTSP